MKTIIIYVASREWEDLREIAERSIAEGAARQAARVVAGGNPHD